MGKKDTAVVVRKSTLPANWESQMKDDAAKGRKSVAHVGGGQFMSTRGGILAFQGVPVPGNKMHAVVLAHCLENAKYEGEYDQDNPQPPSCYAFGDDADTMAPHEEAEKKYSDGCKGCENNKFGSAEKGRGKACKNIVRMSVMHADSLKDAAKGLDGAQIALLKLPVMSVPGWASHVKQLDELKGLPPYAFVTEIGVVPDQRSQYRVTFDLVRQIDKKAMQAVFAAAKRQEKELAFPYQPIDASALKKGGKAGKKGNGRDDRRPQQQAPARGAGFGGGAAAAQKRKKF